MSVKKIVAAGAMLLGGVAAGLALPASANAATTHTAHHTGVVRPQDCDSPSNNSFYQNVVVDTCDGSVDDMFSFPSFSFYGHIEFTGPNGLIGNTADFEIVGGAGVEQLLNQGIPAGTSYWCATLWEGRNGHYANLNTNCVTL
jgi:hypothetical protein